MVETATVHRPQLAAHALAFQVFIDGAVRLLSRKTK